LFARRGIVGASSRYRPSIVQALFKHFTFTRPKPPKKHGL
jgi:hypothetical protein